MKTTALDQQYKREINKKYAKRADLKCSYHTCKKKKITITGRCVN